MSRNLDEIQGLNNDARALIFRFWISHSHGSGDPAGAQVVGSRDGMMNGDVIEQVGTFNIKMRSKNKNILNFCVNRGDKLQVLNWGQTMA